MAFDIITWLYVVDIVVPLVVFGYLIADEALSDYAQVLDLTTKVPRQRVVKLHGKSIKLGKEKYEIANLDHAAVIQRRKRFFMKLMPLLMRLKDGVWPVQLNGGEISPKLMDTAILAAAKERQSLRLLLKPVMGKLDMVLYMMIGAGMGVMMGILLGLYVIPPPPPHVPPAVPTLKP